MKPLKGRIELAMVSDSRWRRRPLSSIVLAGVVASGLLAGCSASRHATGGPLPNPTSLSQIEVADLKLMSGPSKAPPVMTTPYEERLLETHPITYAVYQEALHAFASCVKQKDPGTIVTFTPLQGTPYMDAVQFGYNGPQLPPQTTNYNEVLPTAVCYSEYAVAVAATWYRQNYLSGNILVAQRSSFLSCMRAAGVQISSTASFATIHSFFDSRAWFKNLSTAQNKAGTACEMKYGQFLSSL